MDIIKAKGLSKSYPGVKALSDVSFTIPKGEIIGLVGENGAGKSTCIKIIAGLLIPDAGKIKVFDKNLYPNPELKREDMGYLPEGNPLPKKLRILEYLKLIASLRLVSNNKKSAIDEAIGTMELVEVKNKIIGTLSSGFKQRVGLAAAFLGHPRLILLDEPSRGLDPFQIESLRTLISKAAKQSTIIVSTHGLDELERITSKFIFLHHGKIIHDGELPGDQTDLRSFFLEKSQDVKNN